MQVSREQNFTIWCLTKKETWYQQSIGEELFKTAKNSDVKKSIDEYDIIDLFRVA